MSEQTADLALIKQVQQGNKQAYNLLVKKYQYKVVSIAQKYVFDPSDAQDIAQEAFIKAYQALASFRGDSAFYTWLYRITVNTAMNYLNTNGKKSSFVDINTPDIESYDGSERLHQIDNPENILESHDVKKIIIKTLNALPEELKQTIILREIEELSYEEIALKMGCPIGTVRSRIFRARETIDKELTIVGFN
jgi:RNA polymerase sigma-70 factor, ECF subfamily